MPSVRRIVLRVVGIAVPAALVVGAFALTRGCSQDRETLADVLDRHAAAGFGRSLEDLIASGPRVDAQLQERLWRWSEAKTSHDADSTGWSPKDWDWYLRGEASPPDLEAAWHDAFRADALSLAEILAAGDVVLTGYGWLAADVELLERQTALGVRTPRMPRWPRLFQAHKWFGVATLREQGAAALDALDRLHRGFSRPSGTLDLMVGAVCAEWRDRAHLLLATRGALPSERLDAWIAEPARGPASWADAVRGERVIWWLPTAEEMATGRFSAKTAMGGNPSLVKSPGEFWDRRVAAPFRWSGECAVFLEESVAFEAWLRGSGTEASWRTWYERADVLHWPFNFVARRPADIARLILNRARHRSYRVAALLAATPFVGGDAAARERLGARASLLDAGPWDLGLRCEGRADGVLVVTVDPDAPKPEPYVEGIVGAIPEETPPDDKPFLRYELDTLRIRAR